MFSAKAHYGLKAVIFLAQEAGKGPVQAKEIAKTQKVPVRYLELLLSQLKKARIINSNRGKLGGYYLAKPALSISVYEIITALEGRITFVSSHEENRNDPVEISVSDYWNHAEESLVSYLKQSSIEDLCRKVNSDKHMYHI